MTFRIYPYKTASRSARRLKEALGGNLMLKPNGTYRYRPGDKIINWGNSTVPQFAAAAGDNLLNKPEAVAIAANKLHTFRSLSEAGVPTVPWTTNRDEASNWDGVVYARHQLTGHSGAGIEIVGEDDDIPQAPLYTKKVENGGEYRVHVMNGRVIDYRKKSRRDGDEVQEGQSEIRTLNNGWIYRQGELNRLERIEQLAVQAITAIGLDFGAVDIIMDEERERPNDVYVLEINTAVGLADNTLESYITAFQENYATI